MLFSAARSSNSLCASLNRKRIAKTCLVHAASGISDAETASIKVTKSTEHECIVGAAKDAD
jgi:hypothetical protein